MRREWPPILKPRLNGMLLSTAAMGLRWCRNSARVMMRHGSGECGVNREPVRIETDNRGAYTPYE